LKERAKVVVGETVLVNGATGAAGRLAVQIAKYMGAKKVIATGRNTEVLQSLARLGADVTIPLVHEGDALERAFREQFAERIDVVVDYLWGMSAECLIIAGAKAGEDAAPIRFVQVGSVSAPEITLPSAALRSSAIELMGSGIGSVPLHRLIQSIDGLMRATLPGRFEIATKVVSLSAVEEIWPTAGNHPRTVFKVG
jgi:NADPH:quinone reductase-like Zn-dependent oxidoreductase